jgi:hypothetical protein
MKVFNSDSILLELFGKLLKLSDQFVGVLFAAVLTLDSTSISMFG